MPFPRPLEELTAKGGSSDPNDLGQAVSLALCSLCGAKAHSTWTVPIQERCPASTVDNDDALSPCFSHFSQPSCPSRANSSRVSHSLPSPLPLAFLASYRLVPSRLWVYMKCPSLSSPLFSLDLVPLAMKLQQLTSISIPHSEKDFTFSFESRCMSIHICYFLFQLFLSCYQRFNVDCGNFISLV